jgi:hypothetical protein
MSGGKHHGRDPIIAVMASSPRGPLRSEQQRCAHVEGRSWTLWVCPECSVIEQDEPCMASMTCHREGHGGVPMERVRVYEHTTAEDRNRG